MWLPDTRWPAPAAYSTLLYRLVAICIPSGFLLGNTSDWKGRLEGQQSLMIGQDFVRLIFADIDKKSPLEELNRHQYWQLQLLGFIRYKYILGIYIKIKRMWHMVTTNFLSYLVVKNAWKLCQWMFLAECQTSLPKILTWGITASRAVPWTHSPSLGRLAAIIGHFFYDILLQRKRKIRINF